MRTAETITSAANPLVKEVRRAIARGGLTESGLCVAETFHLLEEALRSDCEVRTILTAESASQAAEYRLSRRNRIKMVVLPDALFRSLSGTETSQGVMALVNPPAWSIDDLFRLQPLVIVLDGVQDPGNAGAIVRAAEAFGATGVFFLKGTVSPYNSKTLRASAGSLFRVPFVQGMEWQQALAELAGKRVELYAAAPARQGVRAKQPGDVDLAASCGIVIGSEGRGVSEAMRAAAADLTIPTAGVESLNAAVAAGILLYEARRQRTPRP